jgi:AcrR family transcriptional regulator
MGLERKVNDDGVGTRDLILDATEKIMVEEGYAAVTSRRVAEKAGLKSPLVHYHFGSMDDLFIAVYERSERRFIQRHLEAVASASPLRAIWELSNHPERTRLAQELIALGNHRKPIRKITARVLEQMHAMTVTFVGKYLVEAGLDPATYPPVVISHVINGVSRGLITEETMEMDSGHAEVRAYAERMIASLEARHAAKTRPPN